MRLDWFCICVIPCQDDHSFLREGKKAAWDRIVGVCLGEDLLWLPSRLGYLKAWNGQIDANQSASSGSMAAGLLEMYV